MVDLVGGRLLQRSMGRSTVTMVVGLLGVASRRGRRHLRRYWWFRRRSRHRAEFARSRHARPHWRHLDSFSFRFRRLLLPSNRLSVPIPLDSQVVFSCLSTRAALTDFQSTGDGLVAAVSVSRVGECRNAQLLRNSRENDVVPVCVFWWSESGLRWYPVRCEARPRDCGRWCRDGGTARGVDHRRGDDG